MSVAKYAEQIKNFIIQNIYFIGQLLLLILTFIVWKLIERVFRLHMNPSPMKGSENEDKVDSKETEDNNQEDTKKKENQQDSSFKPPIKEDSDVKMRESSNREENKGISKSTESFGFKKSERYD